MRGARSKYGGGSLRQGSGGAAPRSYRMFYVYNIQIIRFRVYLNEFS